MVGVYSTWETQGTNPYGSHCIGEGDFVDTVEVNKTLT